MNDTSPDVTNDIETPLVDAEPTTEQEASQAPVSDDTAESTENDEVVKSRAQQRIEQLVAEKKQLEKDKDYAMEYGKLQAQLREQSTPKPVKEETILTMPTLEDSDFDEALHAQKMAGYISQVSEAAAAKATKDALANQSTQAAQDQVAAKWNDKVSAYAASKPDFNTVVYNPDVAFTKDMFEVCQLSDKGAELAYQVASNPVEATRIAQLSPSMQMFEMGKLEASLSTKPTVKTETTKAPQPMSPVGGQQPNVSTENETIEDYMKRMNAKDAARRAGR